MKYKCCNISIINVHSLMIELLIFIIHLWNTAFKMQQYITKEPYSETVDVSLGLTSRIISMFFYYADMKQSPKTVSRGFQFFF